MLVRFLLVAVFFCLTFFTWWPLSSHGQRGGYADESFQPPASLADASRDSSPGAIACRWAGRGTPPPIIAPAVLAREEERIRTIEKLTPTVVAIFSPDGGAGGSGVLISPEGYALTNFHVAKPCGIALKCGLPDGGIYDAITVGWDPVGDIALIKLLGRTDFPFAVWGDSEQVAVGDEVLVMGNPFMLAMDLQPTVTWGIISGVRRYQHPAGTMLEYADCLQTDASINPGNSGGPMFDRAGRLIGINGRASFDRRGRINVGVGYAVPVHQIANFLPQLLAGRIVDHATVGFRLGTDLEGRPVVADILEDSDAWRRGVRRGDELVSFADRIIVSPNDFKNALANFPPGWQVPAIFRRGQKRFEVLLRLDPLHSEAELLERMQQLPLEFSPPPGDRPPNSAKASADDGQPLPAALQAFYEARRGFANFYFNRLQQNSVWTQCCQKSGLPVPGNMWSVTGTWDSRQDFRLELTPEYCRLELAGRSFQWQPEDASTTAALTPPEPKGLLAALYLWYRLNTEGPATFSDFVYWGAMPYRGRGPMVDVLEATFKAARLRFLVAEGIVIGMELDVAPRHDPWELHFSDLGLQTGVGKEVVLPGMVVVTAGDQVVAELRKLTFTIR